jgi:hypothetical protein
MDNTKPVSGIDLQEQLSPHFKLSEFIVSGVALQQHIDNMPTDSAVVDRLRLLTEKVLEPLRLRFGVIRITSGYRCPRLNHAVGGRTVSQHLRGEAADIHISSMETGQKMFSYIEKNLDFDQLLFEHSMRNGCCWLHVSCRKVGNRHQAIPYYNV